MAETSGACGVGGCVYACGAGAESRAVVGAGAFCCGALDCAESGCGGRESGAAGVGRSLGLGGSGSGGRFGGGGGRSGRSGRGGTRVVVSVAETSGACGVGGCVYACGAGAGRGCRCGSWNSPPLRRGSGGRSGL
ncbi:hypothetical protein [Nocardia terpenica]|uniref:hypothetical protein n=1 Tax=Nocardia terpenica TaxID=455432 RepID=UPI0012E98B4F|nr:hypothetical protein [Nocardia terpenica]